MTRRLAGGNEKAAAVIKVSHLTKNFGRKVAVNDISFEVARGEIVGFLGPNGAGKTTTLRIICGYFPPTGGDVTVAGWDVRTDSLAVRRQIGYLPETVPLYPEMRVDEYLGFRAGLKGVPPKLLRRQVAEVKERCGLKEDGRRIIGQLSKGYRQRVGLADTLLHDPAVLILDEPTIGLDPNQLRLARDLIRQLAERHTVLLSTHILPEVELTCQRVLIINEGRIVAADTPANLRERMHQATCVVTELHAPPPEARALLGALPEVISVTSDDQEPWTRYRIECPRRVDLRQNVFELAVRRNWKMRELKLEKTSLEEVFVNLTGGAEEPAA